MSDDELKKTREELRDKIKERLHTKIKGDQFSRCSKFARDNIEKQLKEKKPTKRTKHYLKKIEEKNDKEYMAEGCECFFSDD